jgi:hypothetical protein
MKNWIIWVLAVIITLSAAIYQRTTGPTYPKTVTVDLNGKSHKIQLLRAQDHKGGSDLQFSIPDTSVHACLMYHIYKIEKPYDTVQFTRKGDILIATLPTQPPAGKLQYYVTFTSNGQSLSIFENNPVVIRFKGTVPLFILFPHIFFMFFAMLLSNIAGIMAIAKKDRFRLYTKLTFYFIIVGGLILGPLVQQYAFGELWTGVPFGWDLTDNKTLIAFIFYLIAFVGNLKGKRPYLTILASVMVLVIFSIPHSMFGSELNYTTGSIGTGK